MAISEAMLPEFEMEMQNTRKTLERVPEEKLGWKPHEKSWPMGSLATHIANLPSWMTYAVQLDSLDLEPGGVKPQPAQPIKSRKELLAAFDKNVADARAALTSSSDALLMKPWSLLKNGRTLMTIPKVAVLRSFVMNHIIHHRAQLTVYLRMNDVPVPALYGPSADEGAF